MDGKNSHRVRAPEDTFPFFKRIYRLLVCTALLSPVVAVGPAWVLGEAMGLPVWLVGVIVGGGLATAATGVIWFFAQRFRDSLDETVHWVRRASRGELEGRLDVTEVDEAAALKQVSMSVRASRWSDVNVDRRFLQNVIDELEPLIVLDANGGRPIEPVFSEMLKSTARLAQSTWD